MHKLTAYKIFIVGKSYFRGNPILRVFHDCESAKEWRQKDASKHIFLAEAKSEESLMKGRYEKITTYIS